MKLKKINAVLAILSTLAMIIHIGYNIFAYTTMYYNPAMKLLTTMPFIVTACIHAVLGMCSVFLLGDGTRLDIYPGQNIKTIIQRVSAALIFPLLIIHLKTFELLGKFSNEKNTVAFVLVILVQNIFYAVVISHAAVSFPKAFITLGMLGSSKNLNSFEKITCVIGCLLFVAAVCAVTFGELAIFK